MRNKLLQSIAGALFILGAPLGAETIASVRAMGMGGAAVAYGQDALTAFYNPATASAVESRFDVGAGFLWSKQSLDLSDRPLTPPGLQSGRFTTRDQCSGFGEAGINTHCCYWCTDWSGGVQWNNYENLYTKYGVPLTDFAGTDGGLTGLDYRVEALTFTGAFKLCRSQSLGVGLNVYFSWLEVTGLNGLEELALSVDPNNLTNRGEDLATGMGVTIGWLGRFCCDRLSVGVVYSPRVKMGHFEKYAGFLPADHTLDIPETFRVGAAYYLDPCTVLAGDWECRRYSQARAWAAPFFSTTTNNVPLFGSSNGPGFGWKNEWILKLGVESQLSDDLTVRLGYRHENSPIHDHGSTVSALSVLASKVAENFISGGATWNLTPCSALSGYLEVGIQRHAHLAFPFVSEDESDLWFPGKVLLEQATVSFGLAFGQRF